MFYRFAVLRNFNPRSREGSDTAIFYLLFIGQISIHAPAKGATSQVFSMIFLTLYFNPRSREGSDQVTGRSSVQGCQFQSTLPRRERLYFHFYFPSHVNFNPRSREGSDRNRVSFMPISFNFNPRSREGSDSHAEFDICRAPAFQSTLPRRERPTASGPDVILHRFQSTLPRRERHARAHLHLRQYLISIHAPAKGATIYLTTRI